ncbi:TPA: helix-turn-helix domain-containing protein [Serratia marcescens]
MYRQNHISVLLEWIENNLQSPLSIQTICKKSGYSERHLQRMFKEQLGIAITEYITRRRLFKSAIAIKTTYIAIDNIAKMYQFNSPSSFSRSFSKLFGAPPKSFRGENNTDLTMLSNAMHLATPNIPELEVSYTYLDGLELVGLSDSYFIPPNELDKYHIQKRAPLEQRIAAITTGRFNEIYTLTQYTCDRKSPNDIMVEYSIGFIKGGFDGKEGMDTISTIPFGEYLLVSCKNVKIPFFFICEKTYWEIIIKRGITRRRDVDIERIVWRDSPDKETEIDYYFMIPIAFDEKIHTIVQNGYLL